MNLLLVSKTAIISQIFTLVCKKLNIDLIISHTSEINESYDIIVIDEEFIDDNFNIIKQSSKKIAAITHEELPFDKSRDFIIPRPFLPTTLQELLCEQIEFIKEEDKEEKITNKIETFDDYTEDEEVTVPITDYVESLAEDVYLDIEEDNDESIVNLAGVKDGGILDTGELGKITNILREEEIQNEINLEQEDWKDISEIIDEALDEVREYEFDLNDQNEDLPNDESNLFSVVLNNYEIDELKPLLQKFNQEIIDKLSNGQSVDIKFMLKDSN